MNRLQQSTSAYLKQHADNRVDWHPWDEQALALAREEQKPVLLSIGYSACHWCHVMAHESFEDEPTALLMNEHFVNIKVDREERPDLDKLYQLSHQLLTQRGGGWPLTLFLDPQDLVPFFAGTYFPPQPRHGLPAFSDLLLRVSQWYSENREVARRQNQQLAAAIEHLQETQPQPMPETDALVTRLEQQLEARFDQVHGGFGSAPKFPQCPQLSMLSELTGADLMPATRAMLHQTLEIMALRGLRDPLDGGFYRYCVDGDWTIPHFEKMLYDNAQLLPLYAKAFVETKHPLFEQAADGITQWLLNDMQNQNGGFYASIDADADGKEGGFHTWQQDEVKTLLGDQYDSFAAQFGLNEPANFEGHAWHLVQHAWSDTDWSQALSSLHEARSQRVPPDTDTKILTSWNALAISGLAVAGRLMDRSDWIDAAAQNLNFIRQHAWQEGQLFAVCHDGEAAFPAYVDDHAFLIIACLDLIEARWDRSVYEFAIDIARALRDRFENVDDGGFWFSASDQQVPVSRLQTMQDDAIPSGNAMAAVALQRLGALSLNPELEHSARRAIESGAADLIKQPLAHASAARAAFDQLQAPAQVIISGLDAELIERFKAAISRADRVHCYALHAGESLPGLVDQKTPLPPAQGHLCFGTRCLEPVSTAEELLAQLETG